MKRTFVCRCIVNTAKKNIADKIITEFFEEYFSDNYKVKELSKYWKDERKFICEFEFVLENNGDEKIQDIFFLLLAKLSGTWIFFIGNNFSFNSSDISVIADDVKISGINWINIESTPNFLK